MICESSVSSTYLWKLHSRSKMTLDRSWEYLQCAQNRPQNGCWFVHKNIMPLSAKWYLQHPTEVAKWGLYSQICRAWTIFKMVNMHSHAYSIELKFGTKLVSVCVSMHWWKCTCIPLCASIFYFESCNKFSLGHVPVAAVFLGRWCNHFVKPFAVFLGRWCNHFEKPCLSHCIQ